MGLPAFYGKDLDALNANRHSLARSVVGADSARQVLAFCILMQAVHGWHKDRSLDLDICWICRLCKVCAKVADAMDSL